MLWFPLLPLEEADGRGSQEVGETGPLDCQWLVKSRSIWQNGDLFSSRGASSSRWSLPWAVNGVVVRWGIAAVGVAAGNLGNNLVGPADWKQGKKRLGAHPQPTSHPLFLPDRSQLQPLWRYLCPSSAEHYGHIENLSEGWSYSHWEFQNSRMNHIRCNEELVQRLN